MNRILLALGFAAAAGIAGFQALANIGQAFYSDGSVGVVHAAFAGVCVLAAVVAGRAFFKCLPE